MSDSNVQESWLEMYLYECTTMIEQLEQVIIHCEKDNHFDMDNINEIFRIMHTIKGSSAMMEYKHIANLSHSLEDLFYFIRENEGVAVEHSIVVDFVLAGIDFIKIEVDKIKENQPSDGSELELAGSIKNYLQKLKDMNTSKKNHETSKESQHDISFDNKEVIPHTIKNRTKYSARISFTEGCEMENIRAYSIIHSIPSEMVDVSYLPNDILDNEDTCDEIKEHGFQMKFSTSQTYEDIYKWLIDSTFVREVTLIQCNDINDSSMEGILDDKAEEISEVNTFVNKIADTVTGLKANTMISVNVEKLDRLLDLIGEIVIAEDMVIQNPDLKGLKLDNFRKAANQLSKITGDIQDLVMEIRMVPLQATFLKMNRIVRDISKKLDKKVDLEIIGEETEVDKKIIELISDPIMHLVRNSLDHGIESNEERVKKGKDAVGKITLEAKNEGSDVIIYVKDNGKGLNKDSIYRKAIQQGNISKDTVLTNKEIFNLIFTPGFSTKEKVTEFSGRGVGMDVVAKNIESIGGSIYVDSEENVGTIITLKIPLTLAIIDGMNIKVGEARYTLPTISIKETFRPKGNEIIKGPNGEEMIMVRGNCYVIRKLGELYQVKTQITDYTEGIIVMVEQDGKMVAIFADELIGQQQVVVKQLPEYIKRFTQKESALAGCTLLGDGSISLIIDVSKLLSLGGEE